jgi:hypothetical protein
LVEYSNNIAATNARNLEAGVKFLTASPPMEAHSPDYITGEIAVVLFRG